MTLNEKRLSKEKIFQAVKKILEERITICQQKIDNAQQAANEEEKSSAGDKYETTMAMLQGEKDM